MILSMLPIWLPTQWASFCDLVSLLLLWEAKKEHFKSSNQKYLICRLQQAAYQLKLLGPLLLIKYKATATGNDQALEHGENRTEFLSPFKVVDSLSSKSYSRFRIYTMVSIIITSKRLSGRLRQRLFCDDL